MGVRKRLLRSDKATLGSGKTQHSLPASSWARAHPSAGTNVRSPQSLQRRLHSRPQETGRVLPCTATPDVTGSNLQARVLGDCGPKRSPLLPCSARAPRGGAAAPTLPVPTLCAYAALDPWLSIASENSPRGQSPTKFQGQGLGISDLKKKKRGKFATASKPPPSPKPPRCPRCPATAACTLTASWVQTLSELER